VTGVQTCALPISNKASEERVLIIEDLKLEKPQTKKISEMIKSLPVKGRIMFISDRDPILYKSLTNIPFLMPAACDQLNVYDIMIADYVVIAKNAFSKVISVYGGIEEKKPEKAEVVNSKKQPKEISSDSKPEKSPKAKSLKKQG